MELKSLIESAYDDRTLLEGSNYREAVLQTIDQLDKGQLRCAEPNGEHWVVMDWVKKAVLLYFSVCEMKSYEVGPFEYFDKIPLKRGYASLGVRAIPPATVRYGSYLAPTCILMPSYVNIGAYVGAGTMVDTWATVGSCAQIGANVHLSGGVGIGGVLEPPQASPVIIEDGAFIGSRCVVVEGVMVGKEAVLGAGVVLTSATKIIDVTGSRPVESKGYVPARSVVIPGTVAKAFPAGEFNIPCALIIGERKASTDLKTSLNAVLREFDLQI